jgi:hypothetical protein
MPTSGTIPCRHFVPLEVHAHEELATGAEGRREIGRIVRIHQDLALVSIGEPISVLHDALVSRHIRKRSPKSHVKYVLACDEADVDLRSAAVGIFK